MLRDLLVKKSGLGLAERLLVLDANHLWMRGNCDSVAKSEGYAVFVVASTLELRNVYEREVRAAGSAKVLLRIHYEDAYIPYDIRQCMQVVDVSIRQIFPNLNSYALSRLRNLHLDILCEAYPSVLYPLSDKATDDFCQKTMYSPEAVYSVCAAYERECREMLKAEISYRTWFCVADMLGFIASMIRAGFAYDGFEMLSDEVNNCFSLWIGTDYKFLSGTPSRQQPLIMNQVTDFIRRKGVKVALIVMDGMSFTDFHIVLRLLASYQKDINYTGLFSFVPSITSVARQSLFSGELPREHTEPFLLQYERKQWLSYWQRNGLKAHEVYYGKTETPELPSSIKVAGIVINIIDDLMHNQLQSGRGMYTDIRNWVESGSLVRLLDRLLIDGFSVYLTADHGNTIATGEGRFAKPSLITEDASRRSAIYLGFAGAEELDKFSVQEYTGTYLPKEYRYFVFAPHCCYGDRGTEYVTHGGMTIEEMVVPFACIGEAERG